MAIIAPANAAVPAIDDWSGKGAMAHWTVNDATGNLIATIDAVVAEHATGGDDMLYVTVFHAGIGPSGRTSEVYSYSIPFEWSMDSVKVDALLPFPWGSGSTDHEIAITWSASVAPSTHDKFTDKDGNIVNAIGVWKTADATIIIDDETGHHLGSYSSDWAVLGLHQYVPASVVPEVPFGTIVASVAMVTALGAFFALPKIKKF
jgi:hypothetical protein